MSKKKSNKNQSKQEQSKSKNSSKKSRSVLIVLLIIGSLTLCCICSFLGLILTQYIFYKRAASRPIDPPNIKIHKEPEPLEEPSTNYLQDLKIYEREQSFQDWYLPENIIIDNTFSQEEKEAFAEVFANLYYSTADQVQTVYDKDLNNKDLVELLNQLYTYVNYWPDNPDSLNKFNISNSATARLVSQYTTVYLPTDVPYYTGEFWKPTFSEHMQYSNSSSQDAESGKDCSVLKLGIFS